jgi:threonine/homoserine/homoserine lactone efflux protein
MTTTLLTIWLLHVAAMMSPGANVLLVSQLAASDRARSARFAALGVTVGAAIWATSAVLGVNAVFHMFPGLRLGLQVAGGVYLLYVASRLWRSSDAPLQGKATSVSAPAAFRLGFLTNITNPKSALFFGSVFAASFPASPSILLQGVGRGDDRAQRAVLAHVAGVPVLPRPGAAGLLAHPENGQPCGVGCGGHFGAGVADGVVAGAEGHTSRSPCDCCLFNSYSRIIHDGWSAQFLDFHLEVQQPQRKQRLRVGKDSG